MKLIKGKNSSSTREEEMGERHTHRCEWEAILISRHKATNKWEQAMGGVVWEWNKWMVIITMQTNCNIKLH